MKTFATTLLLSVLLAAAAAAAGYGYLRSHADGFSARMPPSRLEAKLAYEARGAAMPPAVLGLQNPVADTQAVFAEGMKHYADHCASCHANDGSGDTMFGRGMYPKPPDLRSTTLTDGELFAVIENGIRLSGMPAFGTAGDAGTDSWKLVRFLRRMPSLSQEQLRAMGAMNPKSTDEMEEEKTEADFLNGR